MKMYRVSNPDHCSKRAPVEKMRIEAAHNFILLRDPAENQCCQIRPMQACLMEIVNIDDLQIQFTNDLFDPENGVDRNLEIQSLQTIDPVTGIRAIARPEAGTVTRTDQTTPSSRLGVFTSGAFSQGEGIVSGFDRGGTLVTNGLLEVRSTENLRIRVDAFGETGDEEFHVFLAGQLQGTFNVSQELESYFLTVPDFGEQNGFGTGADRDSLIIKFINDDFDPVTGLDNNLTITGFQLIDLESDNRIIRRPGSSDVFTTGTFVDGGIEPGFGRGNTLHANGVFSSGPGFIG